MKRVLREEIISMKSLMNINEDFVTVSSAGLDNITTDNDSTKSDNINRALLKDISRAAKKAGVKVTITTANSGHNMKTKSGTLSRHNTNQAVDIAIIDGVGSGGATNSRNGNPKFKSGGDKLVAALESMGYKRNAEGPQNPKAVFWQTNSGGNHFNHVHVSNTTGESSKETDDFEITPEREEELKKIAQNVSGEKKPGDFEALLNMANTLKSTLNRASATAGIKEQFDDSEKISGKESLVKSKHQGKIVPNTLIDNNCENSLVIRFRMNSNTYYVEYCNLEKTYKSIGENVYINDKLGESSDVVYLTYFNDKGKQINKDIISSPKTEPEKKDEKKPTDSVKSRALKIFQDDSGSTGETFVDSFYNLFQNLNPLTSRFALDSKNNPVKIHQGGLATTRSKDSKPKMDYLKRIGYASSKSGAKTRGKSLKEEMEIMKKLMK
jgi:ribosome-binding protein aMBF1 (putative translation factor)